MNKENDREPGTEEVEVINEKVICFNRKEKCTEKDEKRESGWAR